MTIASAFNEIAVAQGGTASKSGAITAAIDALNDALAGSDQPQAKTIEQAVKLLGEHIGGGGGSATYSITCYDNSPMPSTIEPACYITEVAVAHDEEFDEDIYYLRKVGEPVTEAAAGEVLISSDSSISFAAVFSKSPSDSTGYQFPTPGNVMQADGTELSAFVMPAHDVHVKVGR